MVAAITDLKRGVLSEIDSGRIRRAITPDAVTSPAKARVHCSICGIISIERYDGGEFLNLRIITAMFL